MALAGPLNHNRARSWQVCAHHLIAAANMSSTEIAQAPMATASSDKHLCPGRNQPIITQFPRTVHQIARTSNFPGSRKAGPRLLRPIITVPSNACCARLSGRSVREKTPALTRTPPSLGATLHVDVCVSTAAPEVSSVVLAFFATTPHCHGPASRSPSCSPLRGPRCP